MTTTDKTSEFRITGLELDAARNAYVQARNAAMEAKNAIGVTFTQIEEHRRRASILENDVRRALGEFAGDVVTIGDLLTESDVAQSSELFWRRKEAELQTELRAIAECEAALVGAKATQTQTAANLRAAGDAFYRIAAKLREQASGLCGRPAPAASPWPDTHARRLNV